jgi:hypothetical protein
MSMPISSVAASRPGRRIAPLAAVLFLVLSLPGCRDREEPRTAASAPAAAQPAAAPAAPVELKDVSEQDARYIIGISYPPAANKYPVLAAALKQYAEGARAEMLKAAQAADPAKQPMPFELSLTTTLLAETPEVVAIGASGTSFTGGAHGTPLVARFVWLPKQNRMLTANDLLVDPVGWNTISDYAREQLHTALSQQVDADEELSPAARAEMMRSVGRMIDEGTRPVPTAFAAFEPVLAPEGDKLAGLRFVFPPYQVGPYVDGERTVEVPTAILAPLLTPELRPMFVVVQPPAPAAAPAPDAPPQLQPGT